MKRGRNNRRMWPQLILAACCVVVFCVSAYKVVSQLAQEWKADRAFKGLIEQIGPPSGDSADGDAGDGDGTFDKYAALYAQNQDLFGWICVEGTKVNYPVMYTPEDPEFYLHRAFDKSYSAAGVPFLDGSCYKGCGNYILQGHHMKNGSMFAGLMDYAEEDFWREHPVIRFDLVDEPGEYEVLAAFYAEVDETGASFPYYDYAVISDKETFNEYLDLVHRSALYITGVDAEYGDQLLTLITCSYHVDNGRFVVVARKKDSPFQPPLP